MKITDKDRQLAREIADLMDGDKMTEKLLTLAFWSHRQLPADGEKCSPETTQSDYI